MTNKDKELEIVIKPFMTQKLGLQGNDLFVYAAIWNFENNTNTVCYLTTDEIAKLTNMSERTVYRSLAALKSKGFIKRAYHAVIETGDNLKDTEENK
jgi:predicted transcriptional regulator